MRVQDLQQFLSSFTEGSDAVKNAVIFVEKDGKEILDIAQNLCHVDGPIEPFIKKIVLNLNYREDMNQILKNFAKPMEWPYLKV